MKKFLVLALLLTFMVPSMTLAVNDDDNACDDNLPAPVVELSTNNGNLYMSWDKIDHYDLDGYKIVISKNDSTPVYPSNGYLAWITDRNVTSYEVDNSSAYHNGDFGSYLDEGEDYYFSVTAVYGCGEKKAGNVIAETYIGSSYEEPSYEAPYLEADVRDHDILLSWDKIDEPNFSGYKVVISKNDSTPVYPSNGYLTYITNRNTISYEVDNSSAYHNGDFGSYLDEGEDYYFSVTAVYTDKKVAGNVLHLTYPGEEYDDEDEDMDTNDGYDDGDSDTTNVEYPVPEVGAVSSENGVKLSWDKIYDNRFTGYKVVVSKTNKYPKYPNDGYAKYITNPNTTSYLLDNSSAYKNGDFGAYLKPEEEYYFSITALYGNTRIAGNVVEKKYMGPEVAGNEPKPKKDPIVIYEEKAQQLRSDGLGDILDELKVLRDLVKEQQNEIKYLKSLMSDFKSIAQNVQDSLNNFITYGVDENTQKLGAGERAAVIHSFKAAFNKLPETDDEMADAIKIANGRWPSKTNEEAENRAKANFKKIYLRDADMSNPNDNAAVTVMAYGLRQKAENRNLNSEKQGINTFKYIFGKLPETTEEWNIMQAITYSGATR